MTDLSDLVARVRGLSGRLLGEPVLRSLEQSRDLTACSALLAAAGVIPAPLERPHPLVLELGVRRHAAQCLRVLARWAADRARLLAPLLDDEDRRSIRAMLRGAASGAPAELRLAGLIPTPTLPERALMELSRRGDVAAVVALLSVLANPYAAALSAEARRQHPDLLQLECALNRAFAARAAAAVRHADAPLRAYVEAILDVENAWTALLVANTSAQRSGEWFLDGGRRVTRRIFATAVTAATDAERRDVLASSNAPWIQAAMAESPRREEGVVRALITQQLRFGRLLPLGTAPITEYVLKLRLEVMLVQRTVWSIAMHMPRPASDRLVRMGA
jgi:vacuolar-type H+-ATPase subunit C/Vma6